MRLRLPFTHRIIGLIETSVRGHTWVAVENLDRSSITGETFVTYMVDSKNPVDGDPDTQLKGPLFVCYHGYYDLTHDLALADLISRSMSNSIGLAKTLSERYSVNRTTTKGE